MNKEEQRTKKIRDNFLLREYFSPFISVEKGKLIIDIRLMQEDFNGFMIKDLLNMIERIIFHEDNDPIECLYPLD